MLALLLTACLSVVFPVSGGGLKPVSIPALGRPFSLGDLYDRRREYIIEGPKLWSHEELVNYDQMPSYGTKFEIVTSQSVNEGMKKFEIGASMKLSFLAGLIKVSGSASYLDDSKKKNNQARVSLSYKSTTFKRSLRPEVFTKVTYPSVLDKAEDATDVVVAIQYGAGAIFTFDRSISHEEKKMDVQGNLEIVVKKIPSFSVEGKGGVNITDGMQKEMDKLSCKFHGDFILKNHPGTYEEAIKVYKDLPSLLGEEYENSVPSTVWLYPIEKLPIQRADQMIYDISQSMVTSVTDVIEELQGVLRECNDILDSTVSYHHERIREKVKALHDFVKRYIMLFKQKLANVLPEVRKGNLKVGALAKLITDKEASPFSRGRLAEWISYYKEEVAVLSMTQSLPNYCRNTGDFSKKLLNNVRYTIGLTLRLGTMEEPYLKELDEFLLHEQLDTSYSVYTSPPRWWKPGSQTLSDLYILSKTFRAFHLRKQSKMLSAESDIQFLVREEVMEQGEKPGITIELFEQAVLKNPHYQLTAAPSKPRITAKTHDSVSIEWDKPILGAENLKKYKVTTYTIQVNETENCEGGFCVVSEGMTIDLNLKVSGLKAQYPYYFTVSAYTDLGETSVSVWSDEAVTTKCSPGTFHVGKHECKACLPGTFSDSMGMSSCLICEAGTYLPKSGGKKSADCIKCPAGSYNPIKQSTASTACLKCPVGTYSGKPAADNAAACQKCSRGSYNDKEGQSACSLCLTDSYNPDEGQISCDKCPTGTEAKTQGATSSSECVGIDAAAAASMKIDRVKHKMNKHFKELKSMTVANGVKVSNAMADLSKKETSFNNNIESKIGTLKRQIQVIHDCKWVNGEASTNLEPIKVGVSISKEDCIFKCYKLSDRYPDINAATRKKSTQECKCIRKMLDIAPSSRYEYCRWA